jgi:hypothetical protein
MFSEFKSFSQRIKKDVKGFIDTETQKMKKLEEEFKITQAAKLEINRKFNEHSQQMKSIQVDSKDLKEGQIYQSECQDLFSSPVDANEILQAMFSSDSNKNNMFYNTIVNSRGDIKNSLLNNKFSTLNKNNLLKKTLDCLKGDKISVPTNSFLKVKDLNINDINTEEMKIAKNLHDMHSAFEYFKQQSDDTVFKHVEKTIQKERQIYEELLHKTNFSINKMEENNKISDELLLYIKKQINTQFNKDIVKYGITHLDLYEKNLDEIKQDLLDKGQQRDQEFAHRKDRLSVIELNNRRVNNEVDRFLQAKGVEIEEAGKNENLIEENIISQKEVDTLYKQFHKPKKANSNSKFTFSSAPVSTSFIQKKIIRSTTNMRNLKYK